MTKGKYWKRTDRKWTEEIDKWVRGLCPCREHGYKTRKELLADLNKTFGTDFTVNAFCSHCYESGIQLGLAKSESGVIRGEAHWRHRPVGSLKENKGYVRIKVAEPNKWMQYQRYIWEQTHQGESAEGMVVIFLDGNNRNFDPSNLERVTRGELSVMAELGHTADMGREEREVLLLRARILMAKVKLAGKAKAYALKRKEYYERHKSDLEFKAKRKEYAKKHFAEIMADPVRHEEFLVKQRAYHEKKRECDGKEESDTEN